MEIRKTKHKDLPQVMPLFEVARIFMKKTGNPNQWPETYPSQLDIEKDIENKGSYICEEDNEILGIFYCNTEIESDYDYIDGAWIQEGPYGVIHRIAIGNKGKGSASFCMAWCQKNWQALRVDTHKDNLPMQGLLKKFGFVHCGTIYLKNGEPRFAFEWIKA